MPGKIYTDENERKKRTVDRGEKKRKERRLTVEDRRFKRDSEMLTTFSPTVRFWD